MSCQTCSTLTYQHRLAEQCCLLSCCAAMGRCAALPSRRPGLLDHKLKGMHFMQKAAVRACRNAIEFNSLPAIRKLVRSLCMHSLCITLQ